MVLHLACNSFRIRIEGGRGGAVKGCGGVNIVHVHFNLDYGFIEMSFPGSMRTEPAIHYQVDTS